MTARSDQEEGRTILTGVEKGEAMPLGLFPSPRVLGSKENRHVALPGIGEPLRLR
jgi:hypothetical protein